MRDQRVIGWTFVAAIAMVTSANAETSSQIEPSQLTATFSIVPVDPQSGICGATVASKYPGVGKAVPYVRAGVGGFCTQHHHVPAWGE